MPRSFSHLLVPLDESSMAEKLLPHVVTLGRALKARVTLLRVLEPEQALRDAPASPLGWQMCRAQAQAYLERTLQDLQASLPDAVLDVAVESGPPAERIVNYAAAHGVDLLVMCSHGQGGATPWMLGSVSQKVLLHSHTSVLLVRAYPTGPQVVEGGAQRYRRLLVPLDGSPRAEAALHSAQALALASGAELVLARLISPPDLPRRVTLNAAQQALLLELNRLLHAEAQDYLDAVAGQVRAAFPTLHVRCEVQENHTLRGLHDLAAHTGIDLMVMTAHGASGLKRWPLGRVALNVVTFGTTPLLLVQDMNPGELGVSPEEQAAMERAGH